MVDSRLRSVRLRGNISRGRHHDPAMTSLYSRERHGISGAEFCRYRLWARLVCTRIILDEARDHENGDLWQLGSHRLICGDARAATATAKVLGDTRVDLIFF